MNGSRSKTKGRADRGQFIALPKAVINHTNFTSLSGNAVKLFIHLYGQYNGRNNGDFSAPWSTVQSKGFKSKGTLSRSLNELKENGIITVTRQGGKNLCSLYAVTFAAIDDCKGKLDVPSTNVSPGNWKLKNNFSTP